MPFITFNYTDTCQTCQNTFPCPPDTCQTCQNIFPTRHLSDMPEYPSHQIPVRHARKPFSPDTCQTCQKTFPTRYLSDMPENLSHQIPVRHVRKPFSPDTCQTCQNTFQPTRYLSGRPVSWWLGRDGCQTCPGCPAGGRPL